ncbi:carbohydrate ABC transporter substrate-binding protein, CUT1 family [Caloramator quimbayensis]|uniref:Carbohydrate ABC transporter substrate-binding protein, CUT1 family n=1 Tax=Caloramator quimbayensis TaxID=1147123 RepID=A0A1T4X2H1_9CLOT|nr:extracellular solute-binding protein [Caloramator quimbayensis]SKA83637.1 carbohydrate ABC transporter substrate-binding protein, CUT1 family [Caloramator quimbayensis]
MKKYVSVITAVILFSCFIFSGCSKENKEKDKGEKKTIKVAVMYDKKNQGGAYEEIAKEFEKNNEDTKVEIVYDFNDENKVRETIFEKGDIDIVGIKRNEVIEFAKSGQLLDITDFIDEKELSKKLYKICVSYGKYNGKYYGIGDMPMSIEWFYNDSMFKKYNLNEPEDIKQLIDISNKLKSKKITPIGIGAMDGWTLSLLFGYISAQTTGIETLTSNYGSDVKSYEKTPNISNAFSIFGKIAYYCIPKDSIDINYKKSIEEFVTGKSAILPAGSWALEAIEQLKPAGFTYQVFEKPVNMTQQAVSKYSASAGQVLVIPSKSKNAEAAKKFMEFLFSEDAQKIFVNKGYIASLKSVNSSEDSVKRRILMHLDESDDNSILIIDNMEPKISEAVTNVLQDIIEDRIQPVEAWKRALKTAFKQ